MCIAVNELSDAVYIFKQATIDSSVYIQPLVMKRLKLTTTRTYIHVPKGPYAYCSPKLFRECTTYIVHTSSTQVEQLPSRSLY